jgi:NAD(P)-dependent dehydrogenase (short-subunit alcohol dehydrogenase family)
MEIIITGANRGLGLELTKRLLEKGHSLHVFVRNRSAELEKLTELYDQFLFCYDVDVTYELEVARACADLADRCEGLDMLINNAAVHLDPERKPLGEVDFSNYLKAFDVNSIAPLKVAKYALPLLRKGSFKRIVNVSSEAGSLSQCWRKSEYSYCMTKAALNMAACILQNAVKKDSIKVLNIHPGWFSSDMGTVEAPLTPEEASKPIVSTILKKYDLDDPIYIEADGTPMNW